MVGWYILIGIILFIALILITPVGVDAGFEDNELTAKLRIGLISITIYPPKPKKPKAEKKKKEAVKKQEKKVKEKKQSLIKEKGIEWLVDVIRQAAVIARGILRDFFKHLVIRKLEISITYAGEDADDTAVKYGYFCLAIYPSVSILASIAKCKSYAVDIAPNFNNGAESVYSVEAAVRIRIFWIVALVFRHGFKALKLILSLRRGKKSDLEKYVNENNIDFEKGDFNMEHPIGNLMDVTMDKIKEMIDVNTIVGTPITAEDGTLIIPVSKVSYGFASGGSDLPTKKENKDCFGGGSGAGVTIQPVAFLTVYHGSVRLVSVTGGDGFDKIANMVPEAIERVKGFLNSRKEKKNQGNDFSEITEDDIDI